MEQRNDRIAIAKALATAHFVITGNELPALAIDVMVEDLIPLGVKAVADALVRCRRECRGRMALADILDRIDSADGRPDADEAWMNALLAHDESNTVVWTQEAQQAFSIAQPALEINDKVGARMAFKAAYERLVQEARMKRAPAQWSVSLGWDVEQRRTVLEAAVQCGRLSHTDAMGLLPAPKVDPDFANSLLKLVCVDGETVAPEVEQRELARRRLAELRAMLERKAS